MDDLENLESFARQENGYILNVLHGVVPGENPVKLADRNVRATAESFGDDTALHAMALNTLAFCLFQTNKDGLRQPVEEALEASLRAKAILKNLGADIADTEYFYATSCLQVMLARMLLDDRVTAVEEFLSLPSDNRGGRARTERAVEGLVAYMDEFESGESRYIAFVVLKGAATMLQAAASKLVFSGAKGELTSAITRLDQRFHS